MLCAPLSGSRTARPTYTETRPSVSPFRASGRNHLDGQTSELVLTFFYSFPFPLIFFLAIVLFTREDFGFLNSQKNWERDGEKFRRIDPILFSFQTAAKRAFEIDRIDVLHSKCVYECSVIYTTLSQPNILARFNVSFIRLLSYQIYYVRIGESG